MGEWEEVPQQDGGTAWITRYPVCLGRDDLMLSVHKDAGSWWFDLEHCDVGTVLDGERATKADAMAAALEAAPEAARELADDFTK